MLAIVLTGLTLIAFTVAAVYGVRTLRQGTPFVESVAYVTVIAIANALFRVFTLYHRVFAYEFPEPETTRIALFLQICLAMALLLIAGVAKLQHDATRDQ